MQKYLMALTYSGEGWARVAQHTGRRTAAMRSLLESLGGSLQAMYWEMGPATAYVVFDLPDLVSVAAVEVAASRTGVFSSITTRELLGPEQLSDALALAKNSASTYRVPGADAISE